MGAVSEASHVQGLVKKSGDQNFTFPVGDGTSYRPIGISDLSTTSDITVEYLSIPPPDADQRPNEMVNFGACRLLGNE